jgi:cytochrome P450
MATPMAMWSAARDPLGYLTRMNRTYGGIVQLPIGREGLVFVSHPSLVEHVLARHHARYSKETRNFDMFRRFLGDNVVTTSDYGYWRRQRALARPSFDRPRLAAAADLVIQETLDTVASWHPNGRADLDIEVEMLRLTFRTIARVLFRTDVSEQAATWCEALVAAQESLDPTRPANLASWALGQDAPESRAFHEAMLALRGVVSTVIEHRRAEAHGDAGRDEPDLLDALIAARARRELSEPQLADTVMAYLQAGHETTACTLTWLWYLLAEHPRCEERLHDELQRELGARPPSFDDLERLGYARMLVDETLRLYPPAWAIERHAKVDDVVGGYRVRSGTTILVSPYITHRDPDYWNEPESFWPERFAPERRERRDRRWRHAYLPFGCGPRACAGKHLALMEATLMVATIAQAVRLRLAPEHDVKPQPLFNLRPRRGMPMTAIAR